MVPIETFCTNFCAPGSHPAGFATTLAVARSAQPPILTGALLGAVEAIRSVGARGGAVVPLPARHTEAGASHRVALAAILALALLGAPFTPSVHRARLTAGKPHEAWFASAFPRNMVAWAVCIHAVSTHLGAILAK